MTSALSLPSLSLGSGGGGGGVEAILGTIGQIVVTEGPIGTFTLSFDSPTQFGNVDLNGILTVNPLTGGIIGNYRINPGEA